ncbi:MAG: DUF4234 domain-containing protein [Clostridia bacterium]|nr:DUF4234 domain-containing protein [Clostridia bacterium]
MKYCINCGAPVESGAKFCTSCGARVGGAESGGQQNQYGQNNYQQNTYQQNQYGQNNYQQNAYRQDPYGNQYGNQQYGTPVNGISFGQKNIAVAIILSIVTCGIYSLIWFVNLVDQVNEASDNQNGMSGGMTLLLTIVTCGIYGIYWFYKAGELINVAKERCGMQVESSTPVIYLVLYIVFSIVAYALLQYELNKIAEYHGAPKA